MALFRPFLGITWCSLAVSSLNQFGFKRYLHERATVSWNSFSVKRDRGVLLFGQLNHIEFEHFLINTITLGSTTILLGGIIFPLTFTGIFLSGGCAGFLGSLALSFYLHAPREAIEYAKKHCVDPLSFEYMFNEFCFKRMATLAIGFDAGEDLRNQPHRYRHLVDINREYRIWEMESLKGSSGSSGGCCCLLGFLSAHCLKLLLHHRSSIAVARVVGVGLIALSEPVMDLYALYTLAGGKLHKELPDLKRTGLVESDHGAHIISTVVGILFYSLMKTNRRSNKQMIIGKFFHK